MKILLVGLGSVGQRHAANLRALCGEELELIAYRVGGRRLVIADGAARPGDPEAEYGIRSLDDLDAALAERPDAVIVSNPSDLHVPVALAAARAGCHLFVEKPLGHSEDGLDELVGLVEEQGLVCAVGYQLRFHPGFARLAELVGSGGLGRVLSAHFEYGEHIADWHPWEDFRAGVFTGPGGGVLLSQIHDLDIAYGLFGLPQRVFATGGARSSLGLGVEDTADVLLECGPVAVHVHQDVLQRPPVRRYEVVGEEGRAVWDYLGGELRLTAAGGAVETVSYTGIARNDLFRDELRHFLDCVAGKALPVVGVRDGAASMRIALAARRSLETGEAVILDPT